MASLMPFHGARVTHAMTMTPEDTPLVCVAEQHDFTLQQLQGGGRYIVVHFLPSEPPESQHTHIQSVLDGLRGMAGVMNVFVRTDSAAAADALSNKFGKRPAQFGFDAGGKLAGEFKLADTTKPAVIALDPSGTELFRHTGAAASDLLSGSELRRKLTAAWALPAKSHYNLSGDSTLAIQGYDPVAYFTDAKAAKGQEALELDYRGVTYRFASDKNRQRFAAEPGKYVPTYGGWCASAIGAKGEKVSIDPTNFKVKDGRLFLFYKGLFADALKDWNKHEKEWEPAADVNWKKIVGE